MSDLFYVLAGLLCLFGLISLGFVIPPRPYRSHPRPSQPGEPAPFRPDLPEPVRRHFTETLGEHPPRMETAVVWGRGRACIRGLWVPLRFRSWYRAGEAFSRRMEITWFQRPILRGTDYYIDGVGVFELGGREESGPRVDQGQVWALWAEMVWLPSVFVHDPRIRWEAVDKADAEEEQEAGSAGQVGGWGEFDMARLVVPFEQSGREELVAHFDPETGRMTHITAERELTEPADGRRSIRYRDIRVRDRRSGRDRRTGRDRRQRDRWSGDRRTGDDRRLRDEGPPAAGPGETEKEPWRMDLLEWKEFHGLMLPSQVSIAWGESGSPWSYWSVDGVVYNVNVSDQLGEGIKTG